MAQRGPRLASLPDCQVFLAKLIREGYTGKIPLEDASKLGYLVSILIRSFAIEATSAGEPGGADYLEIRKLSAHLLDDPTVSHAIDRLLSG